jgi:hypothetical protein
VNRILTPSGESSLICDESSVILFITLTTDKQTIEKSLLYPQFFQCRFGQKAQEFQSKNETSQLKRSLESVKFEVFWYLKSTTNQTQCGDEKKRFRPNFSIEKHIKDSGDQSIENSKDKNENILQEVKDWRIVFIVRIL